MVEINSLQFTRFSHLESTKQKFLPASSLFFLLLGTTNGGSGTSVMEARSGGDSISPSSKSFLGGLVLKGVDIVYRY